MGKRVTRFMSLKEWQAFQQGERLVNHTDHFCDGKGGSLSKGFCFTEDNPDDAWVYLEGIVDADVWATFEFPDGYLRESRGVYADHSEGADFFDRVVKTEWCCEEYDSKVAQMVAVCNPFQGEEYADLKMLAHIFRQTLYAEE